MNQDNEIMTCGDCGNELTNSTEVEYSQFLTEYFCNPNCAQNRYFEYMGSSPVDFTNLDDGIVVSNGRMFMVQD